MSRIGTYSIVARDPDSGELGVAVQSHWFSVGSVVSWARAATGAVATQSVAEPAYGTLLLDRLAAGAEPEAALAQLVGSDELAAVRQVALVDTLGRVATHTGRDCIPHAGHVTGDGFSCQANMMAEPGVPEAMAAGFESTEGTLADRLLAALRAAEAAGGDVRGRQSAALVVAPATGDGWQRTCDLRVEDSADPIGELARLIVLDRAYRMAGEADELLGEGRADAAGALYERAAELAPESDELLFWAGLSQAQQGDVEGGAATVRRAADVHAGWLVLLDRLSPDFAPAGAAVRAALGRT